MEVRLISNLLVDKGGLLPVRTMGCRVTCFMAMNRAAPKYQAAGVGSGREAPKAASLSLTVHVLRVQHDCAFIE